MRNIFVVSGYGAAGKSTVINSIANTLNVTTIPFGSIHKTAYKNAGYKCTADWLKEKGYDVYQKSVLELFEQEITKIDGDILVDGLFSSSCYNYLKALEMFDQNKLINIFISTPKDERISRMYKRQNFTTIEQSTLHVGKSDFIKGTCGLYQIYDDVDYIINGNQSREKINSQIMQVIQPIMQRNSERIIER